MKLKEHTASAVNMHKVLASVATIADFARQDPDIGSDGDYYWYGFNIARHGGKDFGKLSSLVHPARNEMGWYGYECNKNRCNLAVYLYCGTQKAAEKTKAFLDERLKNNHGKSEFTDDTGIVIRNDPRVAIGDAEWFQSVFNELRESEE